MNTPNNTISEEERLRILSDLEESKDEFERDNPRLPEDSESADQ